MSLFPGVCVQSPNAPGDGGCPAGTKFEARAPGERARGLVAASSTQLQPIASHWFTSVDLPLSPEYADAWANDRRLDASGSPVGLEARRDQLLRHTFKFGVGKASRFGGRLEIPIEGAALSKEAVELLAHVAPADEALGPPTEIVAPLSGAAAPLVPAPGAVPSGGDAIGDDGISVVVLAPVEEKGTPAEVPDDGGHDSEPPTLAKLDLPPGSAAEAPAPVAVAPSPVPVPQPAPSPGAPKVAPARAPAEAGEVPLPQQLTELAKNAVLSADTAALEKWIDGLAAVGESVAFTDRMRAIARLNRGDIGDALRVLRRARASLDPGQRSLRCQTSLALGLALAYAGRPDDALLEGLDALARARESSDERGVRACISFLARLYAAVGRPEDAARLKIRSSVAPPA